MITNLVSKNLVYFLYTDEGHLYIGSTCQGLRRIIQHRRALLKNEHCNAKLQAVFNKHGDFNIFVIPLPSGLLPIQLRKIEFCFLRILNFESRYTLNLSRMAHCVSLPGVANPMYGKGKTLSIESRQKISTSLLEYYDSSIGEITKRKLSEISKLWHSENTNPMKDKAHTAESRAKMSQSHKNTKKPWAGAKPKKHLWCYNGYIMELTQKELEMTTGLSRAIVRIIKERGEHSGWTYEGIASPG